MQGIAIPNYEVDIEWAHFLIRSPGILLGFSRRGRGEVVTRGGSTDMIFCWLVGEAIFVGCSFDMQLGYRMHLMDDLLTTSPFIMHPTSTFAFFILIVDVDAGSTLSQANIWRR